MKPEVNSLPRKAKTQPGYCAIQFGTAQSRQIAFPKVARLMIYPFTPLFQRSVDLWPRAAAGSVLLVLLALTVAFAPAMVAQEPARLECTPRTFQVVPGEPMRLELTVLADSAAPIRLHVPGDPLLKLRAFEKLPVQRTAEGVIVHRRVVVWQALEPGVVKADRLSVETKGQKLLFPEVSITVRDPGP